MKQTAKQMVAAATAQNIPRWLYDAKSALENLILVTPTGNARNALCDANAHLLVAETLIKEQQKG